MLLVVLLARPVVVWASTFAVTTAGASAPWWHGLPPGDRRRRRFLPVRVAPAGCGLSEAGLLVAYTFLVIIVTVVMQSFTARPVARLLGLVEEEPVAY